MQKILIEIGKPCSTIQKIVIEVVFEIVIEIVIDTCVEQTRLFQCNRGSTMPIFVTEIGKKSITERTRLFSMYNRFHCAENPQSGPSRFFGKWVELVNIYVARVLSTCSVLR